MAFSLLDHLQTSRQADIQALMPALAQHGQRELLAIVLGHLIALDRTSSNTLYQGICAQDNSVFWQDLDDHDISQLAAATQAALPVNDLKQVLEQLYCYVIEEIHNLDRTANLGHAGVSELIQGQAEYLAGALPDQLWQVLHLNELQGQSAVIEASVDLNASIASLNKLMMDASQMNTNTLDDMQHDTPISTHGMHDNTHENSHNWIELPAQRPAPRFFLALEPLIALLILVALWMIYHNLTI